MDTIAADIRYALRSLRRAPGFAAVAVLTLALGIGANTAIFSVVNRLLFHPFPFLHTDRLAAVWSTAPHGVNDHNETTPADFRDWHDRLRSFDHLVAYTWWTANFTGGDAPERIQGYRVSFDYFDALGIRPALGRTFTADDADPHRDFVLMLSDGLWRRRFAANPAVIGTTVDVNGVPRTIVGVMPPDTRYPTEAEAWEPLQLTADSWANRRSHYLMVTGHLAPGATADAANAEVAALQASLATQYPGTSTGWGAIARPLRTDVTRAFAPLLFVLFGAVGFVLLIACANVANLMLARASGRRRELAVRTALGAPAARLSRLVLTESLVLALVGGTGGAVLAIWGVDVLLSLIPAEQQRFIAGIQDVRVDLPVLAFTLGLSLLAMMLCGLVPALRAAGADGADSFRAGASTGGRERHRLRRALVGAEVAIALLLLVGAGLAWRTFVFLGSIEPGFDGDGVALSSIVLPVRPYPTDSVRALFTSRLVERVSALPGVTAAATANVIPMCHCNSTTSFDIVGEPRFTPDQRPNVGWRLVTPAYFSALRIPVRAGRAFTDADNMGAAQVAIVSESVSRRWFPPGGALGRMLFVDGDTARAVQVVGIVGDVRHNGPTEPVDAEVYIPQYQRADIGLVVMARTPGDPALLLPAIRRVVGELDHNLAVYDPTIMREVMRVAVGTFRFSMRLLAGLGFVALLLAAVGIYGVIAHLVAERTREIGIRIAVGGDQAAVKRLVVRQGMAPAVAGLAVGVLLALAVTRLMGKQLVGISPRDPLTFATAVVVLAAVALLACWIPARRAARVDPMIALRNE